MVLLRIVARYAEIAAGVLESVNEKHFRRDSTISLGDEDGDDTVPTRDNYLKVNVEKQPSTPPSRTEKPSLASETMNSSKATSVSLDANASVQRKKDKSDSKKAVGKAKILQLREQRLKMGLKVASKADAC